MKKKDLTDLRKKTISELTAMVEKKVAEVAKLKLELPSGKTKNVHAARSARRDLAQIKTIIGEKRVIEEKEK